MFIRNFHIYTKTATTTTNIHLPIFKPNKSLALAYFFLLNAEIYCLNFTTEYEIRKTVYQNIQNSFL